MMRQYYRAKISLAEMESPIASVVSTILCKAKENDHVLGVVAEIGVETSHSSEVQGTEKSTSNSLVFQAQTQHEQPIEVIEVSSMSNNLLHRVRGKATMTEDIRTHVQCKCELKDDTINLCHQIIMEQFDLSRGFEDTTLSPDKFTAVSERFIQVLNVFNKHWIPIFQRQFGQINICNSLVTDGKYSKKKLLKIYLASQTVMGLFLNSVFFQLSSQKALLIVRYLPLPMQLKFKMVKMLNIRHSMSLI